MYLFSCTSFILKSVYSYSQQQKYIAYVKKENLYKAFKKTLNDATENLTDCLK